MIRIVASCQKIIYRLAPYILLSLIGIPGGCLIASTAHAAVVKSELLAAKGDLRGPSEAIRVRIQASADTIQRLAMELDGFDVTQIVSFENSVASFTPPQPLSFGNHKLRLLEYKEDGSTVVRATWTLSIRKSTAFQDAELQGNVWLDASERIADRELSTPKPNRFNLGGGAQLNGSIANGDWKFSGTTDLIYNKNKDLMPRGADAGNTDLGSYLFTAENGPVVAQVGHFNAAPFDNLVMQGFNRRGASIGLNWDDKQNTITAFSQHTQEIVGFRGGLGVGDAENRSDGIVISTHPLNDRDKLFVSVVYVDGSGPDQAGTTGSGVVGATNITRGNATDMVADSNFLDHRLRVRGEVAATDYDFDGNGVDINNDGIIDLNQPAKQDNAYSAQVSYTPWHNKVVAGKPLGWDFGLENKRIGSYFRSPANPGGIADQKTLQGYTDLSWSGLFVYAAVGTVTDNVNGDAARPRIKSNNTMLTTTYTPQLDIPAGKAGAAPVLPWYGQPSYTLALNKVDQTVENAGGGFSVGGFNTTTSASLVAGFSYPTWNWVVSHVVSKNDNKTGQAVDTRNVVTQLALTKNINQLLNLSTNVQHGKIEESNPPAGVTAKDTDTWTAGVSLGYLINQRMNASLQLNYNDSQTSDHSLDSTSRDMIASLSWAVNQAHGWTPGTTLWLEGQLHKVTGTATTITNQDSYQVFLKVSLGWTPKY